MILYSGKFQEEMKKKPILLHTCHLHCWLILIFPTVVLWLFYFCPTFRREDNFQCLSPQRTKSLQNKYVNKCWKKELLTHVNIHRNPKLRFLYLTTDLYHKDISPHLGMSSIQPLTLPEYSSSAWIVCINLFCWDLSFAVPEYIEFSAYSDTKGLK